MKNRKGQSVVKLAGKTGRRIFRAIPQRLKAGERLG
jgi:hypothetical protein